MEQILMRAQTSERLKEVLIVVVWGSAIAAIYADAMFRNPYPTTIHYVLAFTVCLIGGALMMDVAKGLLGYLASFGLAVGLLFTLSSLPTLSLTTGGGDFIQTLMITIIVRSTFPFPFIGFLIGSMLGAAIGERYLEGTISLS
jgi:hypothetical protein